MRINIFLMQKKSHQGISCITEEVTSRKLVHHSSYHAVAALRDVVAGRRVRILASQSQNREQHDQRGGILAIKIIPIGSFQTLYRYLDGLRKASMSGCKEDLSGLGDRVQKEMGSREIRGQKNCIGSYSTAYGALAASAPRSFAENSLAEKGQKESPSESHSHGHGAIATVTPSSFAENSSVQANQQESERAGHIHGSLPSKEASSIARQISSAGISVQRDEWQDREQTLAQGCSGSGNKKHVHGSFAAWQRSSLEREASGQGGSKFCAEKNGCKIGSRISIDCSPSHSATSGESVFGKIPRCLAQNNSGGNGREEGRCGSINHLGISHCAISAERCQWSSMAHQTPPVPDRKLQDFTPPCRREYSHVSIVV